MENRCREVKAMTRRRDIRTNRYLTAILMLSWFILSCSSPMASSIGVPTDKDQDRVRYIVRLTDPPLAGYGGQIPGLEATNPEVTGRPLDTRSTASRVYLSYLAQKRIQFKERAEQVLAREVVFDHEFDVTINAVVISMTAAEATRIETLPEVSLVERERPLQLHSEKFSGDLDRSSQ
jgi:hypothetical protein